MQFDPDPNTVTITVVDDKPFAQDFLVRAAKSWSYLCQSASTAEQAVELLEKRQTPIVVTDLRMPGRGGIWLVHEIRRRWPDIGIIVLTAGDDPHAADECLQAGANHYFFKPIKLDEFRHVLETTWRDYHIQRENRRYRNELERRVRKQTRRVRNTFISAIDSLVRTMEERDPYTAGHSLRVRQYSLRLAQALQLSERDCKLLSLSAKLHDIGKVGVPEAILNKPGPLTHEEQMVVREHPSIGERILLPIIRNPEVLAGIRSHHERLDGAGYPDGFAGDKIPLFGRLITIPDCFDAMTTSRAYRKAMPLSQALSIIAAGSGTQFQPEFVDAFLKIAPALLSETTPSNSL